MRCKEPLQLDSVEELEMHKKLRASAALVAVVLFVFFAPWEAVGEAVGGWLAGV